MFTTGIKGLLLALAFTAILAPAALADGPTTVSINAGSLSISSATLGNFTSVDLAGAATTTTASLSEFKVIDSTGAGAGWHVTATATQFKEWDNGAGAYVDGGKTIATGALQMSQPSVTAQGTSSAAPTIVGGPYIIDGAAVKIASAAIGDGMGEYDFGATTLTLSLPANIYAKTYQSSLTIDVVAAP